MVKFLADENIPASLIYYLREEGFDVKDVKEAKLFGLKDSQILNLAGNESRVVITYDKDFANLLNNHSRKHNGVVLLRFANNLPSAIMEKLLPILKLDLRNKIKNSLVIISEDFVKIVERHVK